MTQDEKSMDANSHTNKSDAELNRLAAQAMGFVTDDFSTSYWLHGNRVDLPSPATDLNDAVELAEWWRKQQPSDQTRAWGLQSEITNDTEGYEASLHFDWWVSESGGDVAAENISPARALTLAVLQAVEEKP